MAVGAVFAFLCQKKSFVSRGPLESSQDETDGWMDERTTHIAPMFLNVSNIHRGRQAHM
jgi:hypothetical protein